MTKTREWHHSSSPNSFLLTTSMFSVTLILAVSSPKACGVLPSSASRISRAASVLLRGPEAPLELSDRRPVFYVKENPAIANVAGRTDRDLLIIRFDKKKDRRELQTTNGGNMFTFKSGISKDRTPDVVATRIGDGVFTVTPTSDLVPGEYLVTFSSMGTTGYDFGVK